MMATQHGAVRQSNMFPEASTPFTVVGDHQGRQSKLTRKVSGNQASLSPVLAASSAALNERIVSKMNVVRGVDMPFYIAHHTGGYLGNYARTDRENEGAIRTAIKPRPTIDQVMAWSPNFYPDLSSNRLRSMHIGGDGRFAISWGYSNPQAKSGNIQAVPTVYSTKELFDSIFVTSSAPTSARVPVVDRVLESYKRLRDGSFGDAQRLSGADRQRLDDHMDRLSELERRVSVVASCSGVSSPKTSVNKSSPGNADNTTSIEAARDYFALYNDVIVAAFICGTSRIATIQALITWAIHSGDWHQDIAHMAGNNANAQAIISEAHRKAFEYMFLDLANKLDIEEADGKTYLDNTLLWWGQESGFSTHDPISMPIVTAGGAGDYFKTGYVVDYRRLNGPRWANQEYTGIVYNQWLANVLMAMGVPRSEYAMFDDKGYASNYRENWGGTASEMWPDRLFNMADNPLPFLTG